MCALPFLSLFVAAYLVDFISLNATLTDGATTKVDQDTNYMDVSVSD